MDDENEKCFLFKWSVENFRFLPREQIKSPVFCVETIDSFTTWQLEMRYVELFAKDRFILELHRADDGIHSIEVRYEFFLFQASRVVSSGVRKEVFSPGARHMHTLDARRESDFPGDTVMVGCKMWETMEQDGRCFAKTRIGIQRRSFDWTVKRLRALIFYEKDTYHISRPSGATDIATLHLFVDLEENIGVDLVPGSGNLVFKFKLCILDATGNTEQISEKVHKYSSLVMQSVYFPHRFARNELIAKRDQYLPDDVLTLRCECIYPTGNQSSEIESIAYGYITSSEAADDAKKTESPKKNFKSLYCEQLFCDTALKTRTGTFPVHKGVLCIHSATFKTMFTAEGMDECVTIEDLSDATVQRMLLFMYTYELEDLPWESACELYDAAGKYQILLLKEKCSSFLAAHLSESPSRVCQALVLAEKHRDEDLKKKLQNYIDGYSFYVALFESEAWHDLMKSDINLAAEITSNNLTNTGSKRRRLR
ncbi:TD and POZ domain-containing protein 1 [Nephila pilipes]|uniref:TD and POZ domain-containing protein 1 n=1 Tax=Nephila pilipes TaxID=299642 RepID=A0A8X6Q1H1_NEPPI|nr:TD and POZ domain-containing protein 1 [Nephila pilipes]